MNVTIQSDRIGTGPYIVKVNRKGEAYRCSCPARVRCKHMERAELRPAFRKAANRLVKAGRFSSKETFLAAFEALVEAFQGGRAVTDGGHTNPVNAAIREVILQAQSYKPTCPRCGGSGHIPQFNHVEAGRCFKCKGRSGDKPAPKAPETFTPMPDSLRCTTADTIAECFEYGKHLDKAEADALYGKLWGFLSESKSPTPLGGDGSNGTVETPDGRLDPTNDDKAPHWWHRLSERERQAIIKGDPMQLDTF